IGACGRYNLQPQRTQGNTGKCGAETSEVEIQKFFYECARFDAEWTATGKDWAELRSAWTGQSPVPHGPDFTSPTVEPFPLHRSRSNSLRSLHSRSSARFDR